jgi:hypothetical protein
MFARSLLSAVAAVATYGLLAAPALAAEKGTDIPQNSYHDDPLTASERDGIAQEENVSPNDGKLSVPPPQDEGLIRDAGDGVDGKAAIETPAQNLEEDVRSGVKGSGKDEADAILDESKKNYKVTEKDIAGCMKDWDPQTQMSKEEWAESCRTTLEYYPDHD